MSDPLTHLTAHDVAVWLDDLDRRALESGELPSLIHAGKVTGITSNPTIFQAAIGDGTGPYRGQLEELRRQGADVDQALQALTTHDVRKACDLLRPTYEASDGIEGYVSVEVSPLVAHDTAATLTEACLLRQLVDRPNILIKVPATEEGVYAMSLLLAEGISVNMTLLFSLRRYREVIHAFFDGLERARAQGRPLAPIASVASFFVSRVDTAVDARLAQQGGSTQAALQGRAALANARLAYHLYEKEFSTRRWQRLHAAGARPQRPLWASTATKNPRYSDTRYVTGLLAPGTITTMPRRTLDAVADHAAFPPQGVRGTYRDSAQVLRRLQAAGIAYDEVMAALEKDGLERFAASYTALRAVVHRALQSRP
ncbi:transaldolase [Streptomyces sp. NPDC005731]|uniref:transaldolase n=1 Tax=Streptomyces sp. NPDC005731 TaxID=3157056 RepID=UPI0033EC330E